MLNNLIQKFLGPTIVCLAFFVLLFWYSGIGLVTIVGNTFFCLVHIIVSLIVIHLVRRRIDQKTTIVKVLANTSISVVVAALIFIGMFKLSQPDYSKTFFPDNSKDNIEILRAREYHIAFEYELYIKGKANSIELADILNEHGYKLKGSNEYLDLMYSGPSWFPKRTDATYKAYQLDKIENQTIRLILLGADKTTFYGFYLEY